jgi:hypothetical protein
MEYMLSTGGVCVGPVLTGVQLNSVLSNQNINIIVIIYIIKTKYVVIIKFTSFVVGFLFFFVFYLVL